MTTIAISEKLDVLDKYECLMKESVASESLYIRAKETIIKYLEESNINGSDKAAAVTSILSNMATSITSAAMQTALQWASAEKDIALKKLELGKQLDSIDADVALKEVQKGKINWDSIAVQAEIIRMLGTPTIDIPSNKVLSLAPEGKHWQDIKVAEKQEINLGKEGTLLDSKVNESYAAIHKAVADTVVNYGAWKYSLTDEGIVTAPSRRTNVVVPLSDYQRIIAQEQAKGYTYNAWANAATASAGMIGTAFASDNPPAATILGLWEDTVKNLKNQTVPPFPTTTP